MVGFMGSGKTTIGIELAAALDIDFWDMDAMIQDQNAMSIPEIFANHGEDFFRRAERDLLTELDYSFEDDAVISTGGGAPCFFDNMKEMNRQGTTVYLELTPKALFNRLRGEVAMRPLLADKTDEEMKTLIDGMFTHRAPFYQNATYTVDGDRTPKEIVEQILYLLNE